MRSCPSDGTHGRSVAFRTDDPGELPYPSEPLRPLLCRLRWWGGCCAVLLVVAIALAAGAAMTSREASGEWRTPEVRGWLSALGAVLSLLCVAVGGVSTVAGKLSRRQREFEARQEDLRAKAEMIRRLREQRHDFHNQLAVLSALLQMNAIGRAQAYIKRIFPETKETGSRHQEPSSSPGAGTWATGNGADRGRGDGVREPELGLVPLFAFLASKQAWAARRGIRFKASIEVNHPVTRDADPSLMRIVGNLVDNALDAAAQAPEGDREVHFTVRCEVEGDWVESWNTGPTIPPELLDTIFLPGFSTKGGHHQGLGLSVVSQLVKERGGTLKVTSEPGQGTRFTILLPDGGGSVLTEAVTVTPAGAPAPSRPAYPRQEQPTHRG